MSIMGHLGITLIVFILLLKYLNKNIGNYDIRLLAFGALLPDIIDKPLCFLTLSPCRGYSHTLVFLLIICYLSKRFGLMELAFGTTMHFILDLMFLERKTFLWPIFGLKMEFTYRTASYYWDRIFTVGFIMATEIIGLICLFYVFVHYKLYRGSHLKELIIKGRLSDNHL